MGAVEMTHEGRQLLFRVGLSCSREWGNALARGMATSGPLPDPKAPFETEAWHDALQVIDDLRSGRPVKEKFRGKSE
jgi:hypothetical protein